MAEYNNNAENKIKKSKKSYLRTMLRTLFDFAPILILEKELMGYPAGRHHTKGSTISVEPIPFVFKTQAINFLFLKSVFTY